MEPSQSVTLVLLPGLDGTEVFFRPLLTALPAWITPIVVQYPADGRNTYDHLLDVVSDAVRGLDEYWILGWSFSGPLALMLAARDHHRVRGVILCASFARPPRRELTWCRFAAVGPLYSIVRVVRRVPSFLLKRRRAKVWNDKAETWARVSAATLARRVRAVLAVDVRDLLQKSDATIIYLASSRDALVPRRNVEEIVRHAPSTQVAVVEGQHMALYSNPHGGAAAICRALQSARRTRAAV